VITPAEEQVPATAGVTPSAPWATTITYMVALLVIASISVTSHLLTNRIVARQSTTALLVNTAGRQRMLSQRITRLAQQSADGTLAPTAAAAQILALTARMETAQHQLIDGDTAIGLKGSDAPQIHDLYFGSKVHLQQQVLDFLAHARAFAAQPSPNLSDPHLHAMVTAADTSLLDGLDAAVALYQSASEHDIRHLEHLMNTLTALMLLVLILEALLIYRPLFNRLTSAISLLLKVSTTDFMTGLLNRRAFLAAAERELAMSSRSHVPCCLLLIDLDSFKNVNDTYGHPAGDLVLQNFAAVAHKSRRDGDLVGRMGGEEFALILPATDLDGGIQVAERLRVAFAESRVTSNGRTIAATISTGMLCTTGGSLTECIAHADRLLYQAKHSGRNRVEAASTAAPARPLTSTHAGAH